MLSELVLFSMNLGAFTAMLQSLFSGSKVSIVSKLKLLSFHLFIAIGIYLCFYTFSKPELYFFFIKKFIFEYLFSLVSTLIPLYIIIILIKKTNYSPFILTFPIGFYLFFTLFGLEILYLFSIKIQSISFFKIQNPVIFIICFSILLIPKKNIQFIISILLFLSLFLYSSYRKSIYLNDAHSVYHRYIPPEFFFSEDSFFLESPPQGSNNRDLRGGLYIEKRSTMPEMDRLYQFNLTNIRKIQNPCKFKIQKIVSLLEFPIVLSEGNWIRIFEINRIFKGKQLGFHIKEDECKINMEGPLF